MKSIIGIMLIVITSVLVAAIIALLVTFYPVAFFVTVGIIVVLFIIYKTCKYLSYVVDYCQEK
jgi:membrane protein YdbS with pleckstrin-like domain